MSIADQLKEMGFDAAKVENAVKEAGGSLEQAMEWILANPDPKPSSSAEPGSPPPAAAPAAPASPTASAEASEHNVPEDQKTVAGQIGTYKNDRTLCERSNVF